MVPRSPARGLGLPVLLGALAAVAPAAANLDRFATTRYDVSEEDCAGRPACIRAVHWSHQDRLGAGCKHIFFDVGAKAGLHGRFLYEPQLFPNSATVFPEAFGPDWHDYSETCAIAFEPDPAHRTWLTKQAAAYQKSGWRYVAIFAAVGWDNSNMFYRQDGGRYNDWEARVNNTVDNIYGAPLENDYKPFVNLAGFLSEHIATRPPHNVDRRVLMKMDIEGAEYAAIPHLLRSKAAARITMMTLVVHPELCPLDFPAGDARLRRLRADGPRVAGAARAGARARRQASITPATHLDRDACAQMGAAFPEQFEKHGIDLVLLGNESQTTPAHHPPLPY